MSENINPTMRKIEAGGISNDSKAEIHDRTGLFVSITALFVSGIAVGLLVALCILVPELLDAKIAAGVAPATAEARNAGTIAQVWKNRVDKLEAEANAERRRGR